MAWPARAWICLDCRMALTEPQCPAAHRRIIPLADREALLREVWGSPARRQELLAAGTGSWAALDGVGWVNFDLDAFIVIVLLYAAYRGVRRLVHARQRRRAVRAARQKLARIARTGQTGTILPHAIEAMALGEGVAFAADYELGGRRMLHDAATIGFEVLLDSGERVVVPAGSCLIDVAGASVIDVRTLDIGSIEPFDPFLHGRARGVLLRPGDRVEVCSPLDAVPDPSAGYRDGGLVRAPRGLIRLRPC
jgi:hypothetical protein